MKFRLSSISLEHFETFKDNYDRFDLEIEVGTLPSFFFEKTRKRLGTSVKVNVVQSRTPLIRAELVCSFSFSDEMLAEMTVENQIVIPSELCVRCASMTYETLRGVIFAKTEGEALNSVILPPFDFAPFVKEPFAIPLD